MAWEGILNAAWSALNLPLGIAAEAELAELLDQWNQLGVQGVVDDPADGLLAGGGSMECLRRIWPTQPPDTGANLKGGSR